MSVEFSIIIIMKWNKQYGKPEQTIWQTICTVETIIVIFISGTLLLIPLISFGRLSPNILTADTFMTYVFPPLIPVSIMLEFFVVVFHGSLIL